MKEQVKLLLPISEIPDGSVVTKKSGKVVYELTREIKVYSRGGEVQKIQAENGSAFLRGNSNFNAFSGDTEVIWLATRDEALDYLDPETEQ